jgi:spore germination protein KB
LPSLSNLQIFILLFVTITPFTYIFSPRVLAQLAGPDSWLAVFLLVIPGSIIIKVYTFLINNSHRPFPGMLKEHLGSLAGGVLGFTYALVFLLLSVTILRFFVSFVQSVILPGLPISLLVFIMLLPGILVIYSGWEVLARVGEIVFLFGFPLASLILLLAAGQDIEIRHLLPLLASPAEDLGAASLQLLWVWGSIMVVLFLAFCSNDPPGIPGILYKLLFVFTLFTVITQVVCLVNLGVPLATQLSFPVFSMTRAVSILDFIRNIEAVLITIHIAGIFIPVTLNWLMALLILKDVLGLQDYRFLAAPSALLIGFLSILISPNILILFVMLEKIVPLLFSFFYIVIPIFLALFLYGKKTVAHYKNQ